MRTSQCKKEIEIAGNVKTTKIRQQIKSKNEIKFMTITVKANH